jgi:hypothetical protein
MAVLQAAAGNHAGLAIWSGAVHGFTAFPYGLAEEAKARIDALLKERCVARWGRFGQTPDSIDEPR